MPQNQTTPETELSRIMSYIQQDVWPGSADSNAFLQEVIQKLGVYSSDIFAHSSTEDMAKDLNLPCLYSDYVYPDNVTHLQYSEQLQLLSLYSIMEIISDGYGSEKLTDTQLGDPIELAKKWLEENKPILGLLNRVNDKLVELNPKLEKVTRETDNPRAELDFLWGMFFKRNPADIDWFIQTRCSEKSSHLPNAERYAESNACHKFVEVLLNNMDGQVRGPKPIHVYWVIAPDTVKEVLHALGKNIELDDFMRVGKDLFEFTRDGTVYKEDIPEWLQEKYNSLLDNAKPAQRSEQRVVQDITESFSLV